MLLLLLSCSPGCCRGVDWRGLGCMYEINYFESRTTRSRCYDISPLPFLFARNVMQVQLEEGGVLAAAATLAVGGRGWGPGENTPTSIHCPWC